MATLVSFSPSTTIKSADVNSNFTNLANGSAFNAPTIDSMGITNLKQVSGEFDNGNSGAAITINWANGDRQLVTVSAAVTMSYSNAIKGQVLTLRVIENGTGNFAVTVPANTKWPNGVAGTFITTASAINLMNVYFDGTNYLTSLLSGFA